MPKLTYATVLRGMVPFNPNTLARAKARSHQILIDKNPSVEANPFDELTEQELVAKANEAVKNMGMLEGGVQLRFARS